MCTDMGVLRDPNALAAEGLMTFAHSMPLGGLVEALRACFVEL